MVEQECLTLLCIQAAATRLQWVGGYTHCPPPPSETRVRGWVRCWQWHLARMLVLPQRAAARDKTRVPRACGSTTQPQRDAANRLTGGSPPLSQAPNTLQLARALGNASLRVCRRHQRQPLPARVPSTAFKPHARRRWRAVSVRAATAPRAASPGARLTAHVVVGTHTCALASGAATHG